MYATAHRVKSRDGKFGINALLHEHSGEGVNLINWDVPDVVAVAEGYVGVLVAQSYDVPPGGNRVLSFLDVVAADGIDSARIVKALEMLSGQLGKEPSPITLVFNGVGMRFGWLGGQTPSLQQEFEDLRSRVFEVLHAERTTTANLTPLEVRVSFDETGYSFAFSQDSAARVREAHRTKEWTSPRVHITHETMMDFQTAHGDVVPTIVAGLADLRLERVIAMGGVVFLGPDGKEWRRWPRVPGR